MERVIKFHIFYGIDGNQETYFSQDFTFAEIVGNDHLEVLNDNPLYKKYSILCKAQFTGLTDKNGKEIYEGDILQLGEVVAAVTWMDGSFQIITDKSQGRSPLIQERSKRFEIIGNVHEHPHLIK